jgi:hypothetical protein
MPVLNAVSREMPIIVKIGGNRIIFLVDGGFPACPDFDIGLKISA